MNDPRSYIGKSAATIGRAIAAQELDPESFTKCLLQQIEAQSSPVFLAVTRERALAEAKAAGQRARSGRMLSALDGVPIAWKDLIDLRGEKTTAASDLFRNVEPAAQDAPIVQKAQSAGMVSLGKLNLTEFAYSGLGLNPHYGTPLNPCAKDAPRSPGGSSSGSGVAVAAHLAPIAIGTDTGGSVRVPAAFNGVTGYKSSEGRVETTGVFALSRTLDTIGPLAQTVEDCILTDAVLRGAVGASIFRSDLRDLVVFVPETVVLDDLEQDVAANFEASLERLAKAGVSVTRGALPEFAEAAKLASEIGTITAAEAYFEHADRCDGPLRDRIDRRVMARIEHGKSMSARGLLQLQRARLTAMSSLVRRLDGAFLAMPTTPHVAPEIAPLEADDALFHAVNLKTLRNTAIGNFLNLPGVAMPNGFGSGGMPTSFLLSATGGDDTPLLGAALTTEALIRGDAA